MEGDLTHIRASAAGPALIILHQVLEWLPPPLLSYLSALI